jgi:thioredoxin reductase
MRPSLESTRIGGATEKSSADRDVVIVGAGPYGLSAAAHLKALGLNVRMFGKPMQFWSEKMPAGMLLRSPRVASTISDPRGCFTLEAYEAAAAKEPVAPLPLKTFVNYGLWFQEQLGVELNYTNVAELSRDRSGFKLTLEDGTNVRSGRVVIAAGVGAFRRKPAVFKELPSSNIAHCYEGPDFGDLVGKKVAVIGAGQSALESAALLNESGSEVEVIAASPQLRWIGQHVWLHRLGPISKLLYSKYDVGPAGISKLVSFPQCMRPIPLDVKDKIRKRAERPAGASWLVDRVRPVRVSAGRRVVNATMKGDEVVLRLDDVTMRNVDFVLLGTGYDVDLTRYEFLSKELVQNVELIQGYPKLKSGFRSSVPGLHFIGAAAARNFGPLLYFVAGTEYASKELARQMARQPVVS